MRESLTTKEREAGVLVLTKRQVMAKIDREARSRLGISGKEFLKRLKEGSLPETPAKRDIQMLTKLLA